MSGGHDRVKDDRLLTPEQTAEFLASTVGTLRVWRSRGDGPPFVRLGRAIRYRLSAVNAWVDQHAVERSA